MIISPQWALLTGLVFSFIFSNKDLLKTQAKKWSTSLLQLSVVLLGPTLDFNVILGQGLSAILITFLSILLVFLLGHLSQKFFRVNDSQAMLITMGTAICGGSAIGALAPIIAADTLAIAVAFGVVFILNGISIFIFPLVGNFLALSQHEFGVWSALAIHDTSSVLAASSIYGQEALKIATTLKLTRALWIIPVTFFFSFFMVKNKSFKKVSIPWFILGYVLTSFLFTYLDALRSYSSYFVFVSKLGFSLTLFLVGITFNWKQMRKLGLRPFVFGFFLWFLTVLFSLALVRSSLGKF